MSKKLFIRLVPLLAIVVYATMTAASAQAAATCKVLGHCQYTKTVPPGPIIKAGEQVPTLSWGTLTLKTEGLGSINCQNAVLGDVENPKPSAEEEAKGENNRSGRDLTEGWATADCFAAGCTPATFVEMDVTFEELPWASELVEREVVAGKVVIANRTLGPSNVFYGKEGTNNKLGLAGAGVGLTPGALGGEAWLAGEEENPAEATGESIASPIGEELTYRCEFRPHMAEIATGGSGLEAGENARDKLFEPGDWESITVPGTPVTQCYGESEPKAVNGSGKPGTNPGRVEFDQPKTGLLRCVGIAGEWETTGHLLVMGYKAQELINTQ